MVALAAALDALNVLSPIHRLMARETEPPIVDGLPLDEWALFVYLPSVFAPILGTALSSFVPLWEYCVLFPSEIRIWYRLLHLRPFQWQFAPFMTLFLRYLLVVYAIVNSVTQWSNSNTDIQCKVQSVFFLVTMILMSTCAVLAMAWRSNAVVRGVIQSSSVRRATQFVLLVLTLANVVIVWVFLIQSQFTGSWSSKAVRGVCTTDATKTPRGGVDDVVYDTQFWYYVLSLIFDAYCAVTITLALRRLANRSHGFSKLIHRLLVHSVGYLIIILMLMLLGIIWLRVDNAFWAANFIQVLQGAVVVRILISEQEQAQRPQDTDAYDSTDFSMPEGEGGDTSYLPQLASHGGSYPSPELEGPPVQTSNAVDVPSPRRGRSGSMHKRWHACEPIVNTSHHPMPSAPYGSAKSHGTDGYSLRSLHCSPSDPTLGMGTATNVALDRVQAQSASGGRVPGSSSSHVYPPSQNISLPSVFWARSDAPHVIDHAAHPLSQPGPSRIPIAPFSPRRSGSGEHVLDEHAADRLSLHSDA